MLSFIKPEYVEDTMLLLKAFHKESGNTSKFDPFKVRELIDTFGDSFDPFLLAVWLWKDKPVGIIIGQVQEYIWSQDRAATEIVWYMSPNHRKGKGILALLDAYEHWAEHIVKADVAMIGHLNNPTLARFYTKKGYEKREESYLKRFNKG